MSDRKLLGIGIGFVGAAIVLALAGVALAQDLPGGDIDPGKAAQGLVDAFGSGSWGLVIGFGLMVVVYVVRLLAPKLSSKALPWIAVGLGVASAFGAAMVAAPDQWLAAVLAGVQAGLTAAGTWGLLKVARERG